MEILAKHLTGCSDTQRRQQSEQNAELALHQSRDLVLFKGAIEHAARLCRVMVRTRKCLTRQLLRGKFFMDLFQIYIEKLTFNLFCS